MNNKKVALITGASGGIGMQTAHMLAEQGMIVYGAGRNETKLAKLKEYNVHPIKLDMTDEASMDTAVKNIIKEAGHIDILINNAGYGSYGAIENVPMSEVKKQFEVNLFGLAHLTQLVLPYMRQQHQGRIINTSSMGGRFTAFMGSWYHATKYAVESFSDALRMEVKDFGIDVVIIEPGLIKTNWGFIAADHLADSSKGTAYEKMGGKAAQGLRKEYSGKITSPKVIADVMVKAANARKPKTRYLVGFGAKPLVFLHTILPTRWFDYLMKNAL